jgi:hypothetical protein
MRYLTAVVISAIALSAHAQDLNGDFSTNIGAGSTVDSNNNSETINYNGAGSSPGSTPANPVMSAVAPTMMGGGGNDSCLIPSSTGIQVTLFGVSRGEMCLLVFITYGHIFMSGHGTWFHKSCYYDCGRKTYRWYDIIYRVDPDYICPRTYRDA